jgi:hypothetical protein
MEIVRIPLNYGSLAGIASFAFFLILYLLGYNPLGGLSWLGAWIPIVFIVLGIKKHRDENLDGYISYGQALGQGTMISIVFASFFAILVYLFGTLIDGTIVDAVVQESIEALEKARGFMSEEMIDMTIEQLEQTTIGNLAMTDFWNKFFGGFIVSLIVSAILKRNKSIFEEETADE